MTTPCHPTTQGRLRLLPRIPYVILLASCLCPAMASQPARAPGAEAPIESAAATHASADAGNGVEQAHALELAEEPAGRAQEIAAPKEEEQRAEEQSPSLAEPLQRPAPSPGAPPAEEPHPPDVSPAVPDRAPQRGDSSTKKGAFGTPHPPRIIAASPSAPAVELTVGAVQTFAVHARASDKDSRLSYTWFLDGRPVARGPAWVFQAPAQPTADPG